MIVSWCAYWLLMPLFIAAGRQIASWAPFYRKLLHAEAPGRLETLDGLRGLLATGVFFHHCDYFYRYLLTGVWQRPASPFSAALGELAVVLFFQTTGFLFWSRAIEGRFGRVLPFYWGRLCRIAPLYLVSALVIGGIVAVRSQGVLHEAPGTVARQFADLFALGYRPFDRLNGIDTRSINAGVTWTLGCEWRFYLVLPLLVPFARPRRFLVLLGAMALLCILSPERLRFFNFAAGMAAAHLLRVPQLERLRSHTGSVLAILAATMVTAGIPAQSWAGTGCAFLVFVCVSRGADLFGLLRGAGLRLLGTVSYSIYLLHGLVLGIGTAALYRAAPHYWDYPVAYWGVMGLYGLGVIGLSAITYRRIEHPFLRTPLPLRLRSESEPGEPARG